MKTFLAVVLCTLFLGAGPVSAAAAPTISIPSTAGPFIKGVSTVVITPVVTNTASVSISPDITSQLGLCFDPRTGIISGTPDAARATAYSYTLTAKSVAGAKATASIAITVEDAAPTISFGAAAYTFLMGAKIASFAPTLGPSVTAVTIAPGLPSGLSMESATGKISGTPALASAAIDESYLLTAFNASGQTASASVEININPVIPPAAPPASKALGCEYTLSIADFESTNPGVPGPVVLDGAGDTYTPSAVDGYYHVPLTDSQYKPISDPAIAMSNPNALPLGAWVVIRSAGSFIAGNWGHQDDNGTSGYVSYTVAATLNCDITSVTNVKGANGYEDELQDQRADMAQIGKAGEDLYCWSGSSTSANTIFAESTTTTAADLYTVAFTPAPETGACASKIYCSDGTCGPCTAGTECTTSSECATGICTSGAVCGLSGLKGSCGSNADCTTQSCTSSGQCGPAANGVACSSGSDCQSGLCDPLGNLCTAIPPPVITQLSPNSAGQGAVVSITGTGLGTTTTVSFGGAPATAFTVISDTQSTAVVPALANAGATTVIVTSAGGTSAASAGSQFTFVSAPVINELSPSSAPVGATLDLTGLGFASVTSLLFGSAAASFSIQSDTAMTATVPAGATSGPITIWYANGSSTTHSSVQFTVLGGSGASCGGPQDCLSGSCTNDSCDPSALGAACASSTDCAGGYCAAQVCAPGPVNSPCSSNDQCITANCNSSSAQCGQANVGGNCLSEADCTTENCGTSGTCLPGSTGAPCAGAPDCQSGLCATSSGTCAEAICNGAPTNTLSDANNCGDCGISCGSGACVNGACILGSCKGFQVFPTSGEFLPPAGCSGSVRALVVGGGGNGGAYPGSGGGAGFVSSGTLQLSGFAQATVGGPGQPTSIGQLTASGGQSGQPGDGATGGIGGSSGGGKWCGWSGAAGGSDGARGGEDYNRTAAQEPAVYPGGSCSSLIDASVWITLNGGAPSQGSPFPLGIFSLTTVAPGGVSTINFEGGGGGGGVTISGSQARGEDSARTGYGGQGYGAGAGGGPNQTCGSNNPSACTAVPQGASGVVYLEWDN